MFLEGGGRGHELGVGRGRKQELPKAAGGGLGKMARGGHGGRERNKRGREGLTEHKSKKEGGKVERGKGNKPAYYASST